MRFANQQSNQLQTVFGGGYVQEQHGDATRCYLPAAQKHQFELDFAALIKGLRAVLSLQ